MSGDRPPAPRRESYANITLQGPAQQQVVESLNRAGRVAYVSPTVRNCTVIFHEDLTAQEEIASSLSAEFHCPSLLAMGYIGTILLYELYRDGAKLDEYASEAFDDEDQEEIEQSPPEGDPAILCEAFGREKALKSVERVLHKPTDPEHPDQGYARAANRHGDLCQALGLPTFAAGVGFEQIELGELPAGPGFEPGALVKTGTPGNQVRKGEPSGPA